MIFKIHYGLWYGGLVGIIPFMFNYASEHVNASATQYGILYTILPFIALIAKPLVCTFADRYAAHHHCLLFFIFMTLLGYGSLAVYPFFPDWMKANQSLVWILFCVAAFVGNTSMCVVNSIGDSLAINSCQRKNISYGQYRLWGPVGFGIFGAIWGLVGEIPNLPKYSPGILTMVLILSTNILLLAFWYDKDEFKIFSPYTPTHSMGTTTLTPGHNYGSTAQAINEGGGDGGPEGDNNDNENNENGEDSGKKISRFGLLMKLGRKEKSIYFYIFIFTFCGIMTGILWQFFFKYLQKVSEDTKQNFSLVATLALPVEALGGELVFFMLSGIILKKLGPSLTLVACLLSFSARYLLYAYLIPYVNIYWVLLVELFQGPAFGLMYSVLTHQGNYYSQKIDELVSPNDLRLKKSLYATVQGILGASFEGLGLGLGAIIGGLTYDKDPILMWQVAGYSALVVAAICLLVSCCSTVIAAATTQRPQRVEVES